MIRKMLLLIVIILPSLLHAQIAESQYDYSSVAQSITQGCTTRKEKAKAIYKWLCANIAYDTSYTIYTADECWDNKAGVCQAYCELFYQLGNCIGLDVTIISGHTRDSETGELSSKGHSWLFVVTENENTGILIDPTWGAGSVNNGVFKRNDNDMSWFEVDPYWLIFTHYPKMEMDQFIPEKITIQQFLRLPDLHPYLESYGLNGKELFERSLQVKMNLPEFYEAAVGDLELKEFPLTNELRIGSKYHFVIRKTNEKNIALINNGEFNYIKDWSLKDNCYVVDFIPHSIGTVKLSINHEGKMYSLIMEYQVAKPTQDDWDQLSKILPYATPEIKKLKNMDQDLCKRYGIDGHKLFEEVQKKKVSALPKLYSVPDLNCGVVDIPLNGKLQYGLDYRFRLRKGKAIGLAIINGETWFKEWTDEGNGIFSFLITPEKGPLTVNLKYEGPDYHTLLEYIVE